MLKSYGRHYIKLIKSKSKEEEEAVGGAGGCREVTWILPDPGVGQDGGRGGDLKDQHWD